MKLDWIQFDVLIRVVSPLTIGTGRLAKGESDDVGGVTAVHLGADGKPCIPGASLKGALRAAMTDARLRADVFGDISDKDDRGSSGRLLLPPLLWDQGACERRNETKAASRRASQSESFDRPATAIERDSGAVERGKLFTQRAVKRGGAFRLQGRLLANYGLSDWKRALDDDIERLALALSPVFTGITLGRGGRLGYGVVRAERKGAEFKLHRCDPETGYGSPQDVTASILGAIPEAPDSASLTTRFQITLKGASPFIIVDPSNRGDEEGREITSPLVDERGTPVLWPSSLLGAIRARASWLAEIDWLRKLDAKESPRFVPPQRQTCHPADDRFLEFVLGEGQRAVLSPRDLGRLSSVERLFGVPGWRGQLVIASLSCTAAGARRRMTNVAIDRLTSGAKDGALFSTDAFDGAVFTAQLGLRRDQRRVPKELLAQDLLFLNELRADLEHEGLMLGHGAARGLGWFDARIEESAA